MTSPENILLQLLKRFHDPELVGSILLIYVLVSLPHYLTVCLLIVVFLLNSTVVARCLPPAEMKERARSFPVMEDTW